MWRLILFPFFTFISLSSFCQHRDYARHIIDTLSSPSFFGRGYVNKGDSITSEFVKQEFQRIGIQAFDNSYFQVFHHNVNIFPEEMSLMVNDSLLRPGYQYLADPASAAGKGKPDILEISYADILNSNWIQKIRKSNRKALYIDLSHMDSLKEGDKEKISEFVQYLKFEKDIPSKALIINEKGKIPWSVSNREGYRSIFTLFGDSINLAAKTISYDVDAKYVENYRSKNVLGYIPGSLQTDSTIIITAHYDHLGMMGSKVYFPGANDNASGVALLLDLANYFKENPAKYSLCFIAFAGEEAGLLGSRFYVENPAFPLSKIKFLVNLDLAGTGIDGATVVNGKVYEDEFDKLVKINTENNFLKEIKARGEACNSDHCPFELKGVKSFFIYTLGGTTYYHDIFDTGSTLQLKEYDNYFALIKEFIKSIM